MPPEELRQKLATVAPARDSEIVQSTLWAAEQRANAKMSLRLVRECLSHHRLGGAQ